MEGGDTMKSAKKIISLMLSLMLFYCYTLSSEANVYIIEETGLEDYINDNFDSYTSGDPDGWSRMYGYGICSQTEHSGNGTSLTITTSQYERMRKDGFATTSAVESLHSHIDINLKDHNGEFSLELNGGYTRLFRINYKGACVLELGDDSNGYIASGFAFDTEKWYSIDTYYNILTRELELHIFDGSNIHYFRDIITDTYTEYTSLSIFIGVFGGNPSTSVELDNVKLTSINWASINHSYISENFDSYTSGDPEGWSRMYGYGTYSSTQHTDNGTSLAITTSQYERMRKDGFTIAPPVEAICSHIDMKLNDYNGEFALELNGGYTRLFRINYKGQGVLELGDDSNGYIAPDFSFETDKWYSLDSYYNISTREFCIYISDGTNINYFKDVITDTATEYTSLTIFLGALSGKESTTAEIDNIRIESISWDSVKCDDSFYILSPLSLKCENNLVSASVSVVSLGDNKQDATIVLILRNKETKAIKDICFTNFTTTQTATTQNITLPYDSDEYIATAYIWDSISTMKRRTPPVEIQIN